MKQGRGVLTKSRVILRERLSRSRGSPECPCQPTPLLPVSLAETTHLPRRGRSAVDEGRVRIISYNGDTCADC
jgi:hypothetical protein